MRGESVTKDLGLSQSCRGYAMDCLGAPRALRDALCRVGKGLPSTGKGEKWRGQGSLPHSAISGTVRAPA